jgi:hypothetical protein
MLVLELPTEISPQLFLSDATSKYIPLGRPSGLLVMPVGTT